MRWTTCWRIVGVIPSDGIDDVSALDEYPIDDVPVVELLLDLMVASVAPAAYADFFHHGE